MVNMMLRPPYEGHSIYAKLINMLFLRIEPVIAHRNRIKILEEYLVNIANCHNKNNRLRILSIGCGPAIEIQRFIKNNTIANNCKIDLLDFNQETLDHTRQCIERVKRKSDHNPEVNFINKSANWLIRCKVNNSSKDNNILDQYDFIYCAGLFDYLSDKICTNLLKALYAITAKDGTIIATNVCPGHSAFYMIEYIIEWHLIYRNIKDMQNLVPKLGKQRIYTEETNVNVFLEIIKK